MPSGSLIHYQSHAVSDSGNGTTFSDQFIAGLWPMVLANTRTFLPRCDPRFRGGVHCNRAFADWRDEAGVLQCSMDAFERCVAFAAGVTPVSEQRELDGLHKMRDASRSARVLSKLDAALRELIERTNSPARTAARTAVAAIANVQHFLACWQRVREPLYFYVGFEPIAWSDDPDRFDITGRLIAMLAPYIALLNARLRAGIQAPITLIIDGLSARPWMSHIVALLRSFGFGVMVEAIPEEGSVFYSDQCRVGAYCNPENYHWANGLQGFRDRGGELHMLYVAEQGTIDAPARNDRKNRFGLTHDEAIEFVQSGGHLVIGFESPDFEAIARGLGAIVPMEAAA